jgi:glycerol-3-phosphate acyltransferase PlsY
MHPAFAVVVSYLSGSIPSAYLAGKVVKGVDLRMVGSGNLGATNVLRTLGPAAAGLVLAVDALKGALPVLLLPPLVTAAETAGEARWLAGACGAAAILGHARSAFLLWSGGGKGVATGAGVFGALVPMPTLIALVAFSLTLAASRIVSLGSLVAAVVLPTAIAIGWGVRDPALAVSIGVSAFVIWAHRANVGRIARGTEPRLGAQPLEAPK